MEHRSGNDLGDRANLESNGFQREILTRSQKSGPQSSRKSQKLEPSVTSETRVRQD